MARFIDADALPVCNEYVDGDGGYVDIVYKRDLDAAPTIDPVRHGCWTQDTTFRDLYFCDQCLAGEYRKPKFRYCPDCGAKMDAEEGEANG